MSDQIDELTVLRAAILMFADSMLSDLRSIRHAKTIEEAQAPINGMIDRVHALSDAAQAAGTETDDPAR
jgi:HPt (histidine-containing phosphotransfer) domain-containing protein